MMPSKEKLITLLLSLKPIYLKSQLVEFEISLKYEESLKRL